MVTCWPKYLTEKDDQLNTMGFFNGCDTSTKVAAHLCALALKMYSLE